MPNIPNPELRRALAERVRYCHEMGIYDFYRREPRSVSSAIDTAELEEHKSVESLEGMANKSAGTARVITENVLQVVAPPHAEQSVTDPLAALRLIRESGLPIAAPV